MSFSDCVSWIHKSRQTPHTPSSSRGVAWSLNNSVPESLAIAFSLSIIAGNPRAITHCHDAPCYRLEAVSKTFFQLENVVSRLLFYDVEGLNRAHRGSEQNSTPNWSWQVRCTQLHIFVIFKKNCFAATKRLVFLSSSFDFLSVNDSQANIFFFLKFV